ncbi:hypothetical protein NQ314_005576 [Rhamnusium bicolor]|uniref:Nucleolar complex-associated protein 3 N-terminal domain-containing protein n=1 Tax=Rhamnusium bicolor TaxID=1586634 RepID=A0AAV8ZG72_9CUCU|nr:hypothetical protein NQ314_005576 [Rhamnusium bicolor]
MKKPKMNDDDTLENEYVDNVIDSNSGRKVKSLLPIKTKSGVIPQQILEEVKDEEIQIDEDAEEEELSDKEEFSIQDSEFDLSQPISATQLLAARNEILRQKKIHIGTLSSGLLENPEEKIMNLKTLFSIMDEETPEVYLTVRKLVIVSLLEVFKDILPSYEIKHTNNEGVKCDSRKRTEDEIKLSILAIQAMCDLLVAHPYFNFSQNVAQAIVPFLNSHNKKVREIVNISVKTVIKEDKKRRNDFEDITEL